MGAFDSAAIMKPIAILFEKLRLRREYRNEMESLWLREYFQRNYSISVGMYSYGCFDPKRFPRGMVIGRYCSFAQTCHFLGRNHGLDYLSLHPYLFNLALGLVDREVLELTRFVVEDDVWVGHNAIVLPSVRRIGRGAVIAAGAVVSRDVKPYEVVAGVPAKCMRKRFTEETIRGIEALEWWNWSRQELACKLRDDPELVYAPTVRFSR